ncbi:MAG: cytochrome b/b6 domain-containing protein [Burkholderiaceae bacterium]
MNTPAAPDDVARPIRVWDLPIRLFHWLLLVAVFFSWFSIDVLDNIGWHVRSGQFILGLLVFRLAWGLFGSRSALFLRFVRGPGTVLRYLRGQAVPYVGHNPLGALSVVAMLAVLLTQVLSGLGSDDEIFTTGPLAKFLSADQVALANWIHEENFNLLLGLVVLHVLAIAYYRVARGRNLVRPMVTGRGMSGSDGAGENQPAPAWRAWFAAALAAGVAWGVFAL